MKNLHRLGNAHERRMIVPFGEWRAWVHPSMACVSLAEWRNAAKGAFAERL